MSDGLFGGINVGLSMWESYPVLATKLKREEKIGLAEAVTSSIPSTSHIALQRKSFCSIQMIGGVALTHGLIPPVEKRLLRVERFMQEDRNASTEFPPSILDQELHEVLEDTNES